jgi:hypothetical protein
MIVTRNHRLTFKLLGLEHFPAKCAAVRRRKCDKCKTLERVSDSKGTVTALDIAEIDLEDYHGK